MAARAITFLLAARAAFGSARAEEGAAPYDFAVGAVPGLSFDSDATLVVLALDLEKPIGDPWTPFVRFAAGVFDGRRESKVASGDFREIVPGARYYFTPFSDSWVVAGAVHLGVAKLERREAPFETTTETVMLHVAGGYRWIWDSGFFVSLGTGPGVAIYERYTESPAHFRRISTFPGQVQLGGMSAIGAAF